MSLAHDLLDAIHAVAPRGLSTEELIMALASVNVAMLVSSFPPDRRAEMLEIVIAQMTEMLSALQADGA